MPRESYLSKIREMVDGLKTTPYLEALVAMKEYIDSKYKRPAHIYCVTKRLLGKADVPVAIQKLAAKILRETREEFAQSQTKAQRALERRNQSVAYFSPAYVLAVIRESGREAGEDPIRKFIALQLACGCRQRDIFDPSICNFRYYDLVPHITGPVPGRYSDMQVVQIGSTKRRGGELFHRVLLLIGMDASEFLYKICTFRMWLQMNYRHMSVAAVTSKLNRELSHKTKELFPVNQERAGTHVNRAIYAAMLRYFGPSNGMQTASAPRGVQQALGHNQMSSSLHYLYVDIDEKGFSQKLS